MLIRVSLSILESAEDELLALGDFEAAVARRPTREKNESRPAPRAGGRDCC